MDITTSKKKEFASKKMFLERIRNVPESSGSDNNNNKCFTEQQARPSITMRGSTRCRARLLSGAILLFYLLLVQQTPGDALASRFAERSTGGDQIQQYHEISVQPGTHVRIECRLPTPSESIEHHYWNFQQELPDASPKSYVLAFESKSVPEPSLGHQLDMDLPTGLYDMVINNVTTNNNGLYKCDYKTDKQSIQKEIRLTVLSK